MGFHAADADGLRALEEKIFRRCGFDEEAAARIADVIMQADLFGISSHGVQRLKYYCDGIASGRILTDGIIKTVYETPVSAVLDAGSAAGQLAASKGVETAIEKARANGIGMVSIRNSNHFGIAGYYSYQIAKEGLIGLSMTNACALVLPTNGMTPMLGTNPIALTVPAYPHPFHLDMSTSVVTCGKMQLYAKTGKTPPPGWAQNEDGTENRDAARFVRNNQEGIGGLYPLGGMTEEHGGHKGYGIAMLVELFTGIFSGGKTSDLLTRKSETGDVCHFVAAIDPKLFNASPEEIFRALSDYCRKIRESEKLAGKDAIFVHGDKAFRNMELARTNGVVIDDVTWSEIAVLCERCGIDAAERESIEKRD